MISIRQYARSEGGIQGMCCLPLAHPQEILCAEYRGGKSFAHLSLCVIHVQSSGVISKCIDLNIDQRYMFWLLLLFLNANILGRRLAYMPWGWCSSLAHPQENSCAEYCGGKAVFRRAFLKYLANVFVFCLNIFHGDLLYVYIQFSLNSAGS